MFINIELELEKVSCVTIVFDVLKYSVNISFKDRSVILSHVVTHTPTQFFKTTKTTSLKNSTNRNHLPIIE